MQIHTDMITSLFFLTVELLVYLQLSGLEAVEICHLLCTVFYAALTTESLLKCCME